MAAKYKVRHDYHATHDSGARPFSAVRYIVLHDMEVTDYNHAAENVGAYFEMQASGGSTNYGIDNDSIQQYLGVGTIPWGAPYVNTSGVHIEQMGAAQWSRDKWLTKAAGTLDRTAWLIARLSIRLGIPIVHLSDAQLRAGHARGVITHRQASRVLGGTHTDPGPNYPLGVVLDKARAYKRKGV